MQFNAEPKREAISDSISAFEIAALMIYNHLGSARSDSLLIRTGAHSDRDRLESLPYFSP